MRTKRYVQLARETWWLWTIFLGGSLFTSIAISWIFIVMIPICICIFIYFANVRYDDEGNYLGG